MEVIKPKKKVIHPKTLAKLERYRQLLLISPNRKRIMDELKLSDRDYKRLMDLYKEINWSPEVIERKRDEDLEKISTIERKVFNDVLHGKIKPTEFVAVNKHNQDTKARYGFIPTEKVDINVSGNIDLNTKMRFLEEYLKDLEKKKKENKL